MDINMVIITLIIIVLSILLFLLFLRLYCRLTLGMCHSQQDMTGKTVLITGASAGIGKATALNLAQRNARVLMACRDLEKAEKVKEEIIAATGNTNVEIKHLELASFSSVRKCAEDVINTENRLDVLINNAGAAQYRKSKTEDGMETVMQINHLGHFLLTLLLLDLLKKSQPSRIINVSSLLYLFAVLDVEDMDGSKSGSIMTRLGNLYNRAKLANILFTVELARRLDGTGVTVNALHPGVVKTSSLYRDTHPAIYLLWFILFIVVKSVEEGAQTSIYLAVDPDLEKTTGKFFYDCEERCLFGKARNKELALKLFQKSENVVGEKYGDI